MVETDVRYVPCRVEPGMFRGEYLVYLEVLDPQDPDRTLPAQTLVDHREVEGVHSEPRRNNPVPGWLRVEVVGVERGAVRVVLPQPAQPFGESALIPEGSLREK